MKLSFRKSLLVAVVSLAGLLAALFAPPSGAQTTPPNPGNQLLQTLTGNEQVPFDTCVVACGATTKTIAAYVNSVAGDSSPRNLLIGGDYGTNPFQRGSSNGAAHISNTTTYGPDGVAFLGGASSSIDWSQQTAAADTPVGAGASLRFQRTAANADTAAVCKIQVLESIKSVRFQGQSFVLSVQMLAGANFSAASKNVQITVAYGTGTNQTAASFAAGTWTNQTSAYQANTAISTTWTRYAVTGAIPTQVAATNVNQIGIKYCFTPVGTAGANDWVEFALEQLEVSGTAVASAFDYHDPATELNVAQRRLIVINEPASGVNVGTGYIATTSTCNINIALPDTMAAAPTVTFGGTALSASTWKVANLATTTAVSTPFLAVNGAHVTTNINLTATTGATLVAGQGCALQGNAGGSKIIISAEL